MSDSKVGVSYHRYVDNRPHRLRLLGWFRIGCSCGVRLGRVLTLGAAATRWERHCDGLSAEAAR